MKAQLEKEAKEDSENREQLEQERRDHELALRLAQESNGQVEENLPILRKYVIFFCSLGELYKKKIVNIFIFINIIIFI